MLHHCNTDRLIAMWQAIHYDNLMFTTSGVSNGQWGTAAKTATTADSPLKPFFQADLATLHTSNSVAAIKTFGYTYPEINDWSTTPEELATYVRAQVNALYGPDDLNGGANSGSKSRIRGARYDKPPSQQQFSKYYTAEVSVDRSELPLPVTVNLVVSGDEGGVVLGRMAILGMPSTGMTYASIPIQRAMLRMTGNLSSVVKNLVPHKVIPFLQQNLMLEIRKV
jgi:tyrosinase